MRASTSMRENDKAFGVRRNREFSVKEKIVVRNDDGVIAFPFRPKTLKQFFDLKISDLREILIPLSDREERRRSFQSQDFLAERLDG